MPRPPGAEDEAAAVPERRRGEDELLGEGSPGWRTKGLRRFQVSRAARDARGKRLFPQGRAARGTSRSSTEQRPSEQSWSTGKRRRQRSSSGIQGQEAGQQQTEGAGGREGAASREQQQDPFSHWSHRKCKMLPRGKGWLHTPLSPAVTSPRHPWRQTELSTATGCEWPQVTCTWAPPLALGRRAAGAPVLVLQQPSWASCPFTPRDSQSLHTTLVCSAGGGSLAAPLGALEVWSKEVLGSAELQQPVWRWPWQNIDQEFARFFPLLPFVKRFVPGSSQLCGAQSGRMVQETWVLVWEEVGNSPLPCRLYLSLCCSSLGSWGSCVAVAQGKGGTGKQD
ncbi:uncharacterized protein LOC121353351 [Pyrgilauda ruficollis]|uniref:uncharacterized protein LOC121353351 n=1 Tax=Pyrgilauda ruficollis TaxID=221976 RepID=UPI001B87DC5F|nr:uncharacterized protein LOC121353351 [Pyrgilauda ruficollis]